jgi:hypothetical protein
MPRPLRARRQGAGQAGAADLVQMMDRAAAAARNEILRAIHSALKTPARTAPMRFARRRGLPVRDARWGRAKLVQRVRYGSARTKRFPSPANAAAGIIDIS